MRTQVKQLTLRAALLAVLSVLPFYCLLEEFTSSEFTNNASRQPPIESTRRFLTLVGTTLSAKTLASRAGADRDTPLTVSIVAHDITEDLLPTLLSFKVKELHISCRQLSDHIGRQLCEFSGLEQLAVSGTGASAWRDPLLTALPDCNLHLSEYRSPKFELDGAGSIGHAASIRTEAVDTMLDATTAVFASRIGGGGFCETWDQRLPQTTTFHTPATVKFGTAMLRAYQATGATCFLTAARAAGDELVATQLLTGGWERNGEVGLIAAKTYGYRKLKLGSGHGTYLDYPHTFDVMRFLMALDIALRDGVSVQKDQALREAIDYCLTKLVEKQYPNGAWPLWLKNAEPPDRRLVVRRASLPTHWSKIRSTDGHGHYRYHYTINDNVTTNVIELLLVANDAYDRQELVHAAERGGDFLLLSQLPSPQCGWAQQYDWDMHPSWARSFEPPAISGRESQVVINSLLRLYSHTGRQAYLHAAKEGIDYLQSQCEKSNDQFARFYELETNLPLFVSKRYMLTHNDKQLIEHYSMRAGDATPALDAYYQRLVSGKREPPQSIAPVTQEDARETIAALQKMTALESGRGIDMSRFCEFLETLAKFISQQKVKTGTTEHATNP